MSGDAPSPPAAESAPSTADVAANVVEQFEPSTSDSTPAIDLTQDTSGGETAVESKPAADTRPEATPAVVEPPPSEEELLLREFGFKHMYKPDGRQHYIPRDKVLQMIASGLKRGTEKWGAERQTIEQQVTQYKADLDELYTDVRGDPRAFIEKIAQHDPRYKALLESQAQAAPAPAFQEAFPEPDLPLSDGSRTFSLQAIQTKLVPWLEAKINAGLEKRVEERLKPLTEREQQAKQAEQQQQATQALRTRAQASVHELTTLPMFGALPTDGSLTPFQTEVLNVLKADSAKARAENRRPTMTPKEAYWEVAGKKLTADHNTQRASIIAELNATAARTPAVPRNGEAPRVTGPMTTADHAARVLARLEKG